MVKLKAKFIDLVLFPILYTVSVQKVILILGRFLPTFKVFIFKNLFLNSIYKIHIFS